MENKSNILPPKNMYEVLGYRIASANTLFWEALLACAGITIVLSFSPPSVRETKQMLFMESMHSIDSLF